MMKYWGEIMILDSNLSLDAFVSVVRDGELVQLAEGAKQRISQAHSIVEHIINGDVAVYGVNTGFGSFANVQVPRRDLEELQLNLILSHAIGVGDALPGEVVRGMLLLRAQSLALGHSGVRPQVIERLLALLNARAHPIVPAQGSVGASGDLAPLAHIALTLIGHGDMEYQGEVQPTRDVLDKLKLKPLVLQAKEGLALINGTQLMGSLLALAVADAQVLLGTANLAAAMTIEALYGSHRPFQSDVVGLRPHPGAVAVADELRFFLRDSQIASSHAEGNGKVQDAYSLRAAPQVHGASLDILTHAEQILDVEFASVTDNPLIFPTTGEVVSGANFHGQPLAVTIDALKIAVAELGSISERRCEQLLNPSLSGLPGFLAPQGGLNSGFMIAQYTAAALVGENKVLAHPASVDSIPTSANQEDHVSMGAHGARQLRSIIQNVQYIIGIELMCAAQALDFQPLRAGLGAQAAWEHIRAHVHVMTHDRYYRPDLLKIVELVCSGELLQVAREA